MPARPRKSKLYTRTGDTGETALFGGRRVPKDHPRVQAYGSIDELNSVLGVAASFIRQRKVVAILQEVQNELFNVGAELATSKPARRAKGPTTPRLSQAKVRRIESLIDEYDAGLAPLRTFILPSGSSGAALLHLARTIGRRAERDIVTLSRKESVNPALLAYVNRLCDLLFVLARRVNKAGRRQELAWQQDE